MEVLATTQMINVDRIYPHPENPRQDLGDLTELTASIKEKGVLQNLVVIKGHHMSKDEKAALLAQYSASPDAETGRMLAKEWSEDGYYSGTKLDSSVLMEAVGIGFDRDKTLHDEETKLDAVRKKDGIERLMLAVLIATYDGDNVGFFKIEWSSGRRAIRHRNHKLEEIYKLLVSLGYEQSEDEIQLQDGNHPLFKEGE